MEKQKSLRRRIAGLFVLMTSSSALLFGFTSGAMAASSQSIKGTVDVEYVAENVAATVSGTYTVRNGQSASLSDGAGHTTLTYSMAGSSESVTLKTGNQFSLDSTDTYVLVKHSFTNDISSGGRNLVVTLSADNLGSISNVKTYYYPSNYASEGYQDIVDNGYTTFSAMATAMTQTVFYVAPTETFYYYIVLEIDDDSPYQSIEYQICFYLCVL